MQRGGVNAETGNSKHDKDKWGMGQTGRDSPGRTLQIA